MLFKSRNKYRTKTVTDRKGEEWPIPVDERGIVPRDALENRSASRRSLRGFLTDLGRTSKRVYPLEMEPEQALQWYKAPNKSDIEGIDAPIGTANIPVRTSKKATGRTKKAAKTVAKTPNKEATKSVKKTATAKTVPNRTAKPKTIPSEKNDIREHKKTDIQILSDGGEVTGARIKDLASAACVVDMIPITGSEADLLDPAHVAAITIKSHGPLMGFNQTDGRYCVNIRDVAKEVDAKKTYHVTATKKELVLTSGNDVLRFDIDDTLSKRSKLPDFSFDSVVETNPKELNRIVKQAKTFTNRVELDLSNDGFLVKADGKDVNMERRLDGKLIIGDDSVSGFSTEYLDQLTGMMDKDGTVEIGIKTDYPMMMNGKRNDLDLEVMLAPRMEEE